MRYYRYSEDWISNLEGDFRARMIETLRGLSLKRLQKYPPPKISGLPVGNETRILSRFARGKSSQLDPSVFSGLLRSFLSADEKRLYRAFRQNKFLSVYEWAAIIGSENVDDWIAHKFLRTDQDGDLQCQFSIVSLDGLIFAAEPLKDHGVHWEAEFVTDNNSRDFNDIRPFYHAYIGLDTLQMIEVMEKIPLPKGGRYLDCGPGSGGLLLYFARRFDEAIGIDINPRASVLSQFNADLNGLENCKTYNDDALELAGKYGKFDLVSWNLPFIFMPEKDKDNFIDAFGGEMGIGLCLSFLKTLPEIMTETGVACIAAMAPILENGENFLESKLLEILGSLSLDCETQVAQISLAHSRELWQFHKSFGLRTFENVYLFLERGHGKLSRIEAPISRRIVDFLRERMYARKFA